MRVIYMFNSMYCFYFQLYQSFYFGGSDAEGIFGMSFSLTNAEVFLLQAGNHNLIYCLQSFYFGGSDAKGIFVWNGGHTR
ncbi:hypothetical protein ACS0TY_000341 [Phlomoides rotata]